ncbi:HET-domain-containing protein [Daldinia caldariorum]|uniref:HET-domain-containing protein n=1 Tax=Daldinia caldariorum TaxID=326644 RepID=UPI002007F329|nr:HET-domain-containing protein [Daldinia caldariorum]KAI1463568.1 HET-domain-containing protein [Daldinia caldariorum]
MRLLNTNTLEVVEFTQKRPRYAILSHLWENEEVLFQDIKDGHASLRQAIKDGYEWVWIDTCCIDKCSSAELSEAINSMYRWYADSCICYAYLSDPSSGDPNKFSCPRTRGYFKDSRWFTRGWTLQELVAPRRIKFYSEDWTELGTKSNLREIITEVTGINEDVLLGCTSLSDITVALKMSWAANRSTTRVEDMAYCLMGIFDINMPLLYGEGTKSFKRLQEKIIHQYEDYTILLCNAPQPNRTPCRCQFDIRG